MEGTSTPSAAGGAAFGDELCVQRLKGDGIADGAPQRLAGSGESIIAVDWNPDGRTLVFSSNRGGLFGLWAIHFDKTGEIPRQIALSGDITELSIARQGGRMVFTKSRWDANLYRVALKDGAAAEQIASSTQDERSPQYSPDGSRLVFVSERTGHPEIWTAAADGSKPTEITSMRGPPLGSPRWSPHGREIAFDSVHDGLWQIFVVRADGGVPRQITFGPEFHARPGWSSDGKWIYCFGSKSTWKLRADGTNLMKIASFTGEATESPDGRYLFVSRDVNNASGQLLQMPTGGGEPKLLLTTHELLRWAVAQDGLYFLDSNPNSTRIMHFPFGQNEWRTLVKLPKNTLVDGSSAFTVSPDGHWAVFGAYDLVESDLMLVENFH